MFCLVLEYYQGVIRLRVVGFRLYLNFSSVYHG